MPVVRVRTRGGWQADEVGVLLDALDAWDYAEAPVAERENAAKLIWLEFNSLFRPSSRDDAELWRGLQWHEPRVEAGEGGGGGADDGFDPDVMMVQYDDPDDDDGSAGATPTPGARCPLARSRWMRRDSS